MRIKIIKNGPYEVTGNVPLKEMKIGANRAGESVCWEEGRTFETGETYHLCRCGQSKNKPSLNIVFMENNSLLCGE